MKIHYNEKLKPRARRLRTFGTLAEALLWNEIKDEKLGRQFLRQRPIGNYIVDFYCPTLKLVIEVDGSSHETKKDYDAFRDEYLRLNGLHIMRFSDADVKINTDLVLSTIKEYVPLHQQDCPKSKVLGGPPLKKGATREASGGI